MEANLFHEDYIKKEEPWGERGLAIGSLTGSSLQTSFFRCPVQKWSGVKIL
jgi:hypothetical protein